MKIEERFLPFGSYLTYCRIVHPEGKKTPLLLLHGGPGSTHNSFELFDAYAPLWDRPIILYDQFGCGLSSFQDDKPELYCASTWISELKNVISALGLASFHLLGHSWGGMLALLYALDEPSARLKSLVLSSTLSSASLWKEETHRLIQLLPLKDQKAIEEAETKEDFDSPVFQEAMDHYLRLTVSPDFKKEPSAPDCLKREKKAGNVAYRYAWGPSEFQPMGSLKDYEITQKLSQIHVPSLILFGEKDESTFRVNEAMHNALGPQNQMVEIPGARHMTYWDNPDVYFSSVQSFLDRVDFKG